VGRQTDGTKGKGKTNSLDPLCSLLDMQLKRSEKQKEKSALL
jgi:hypothetical protein